MPLDFSRIENICVGGKIFPAQHGDGPKIIDVQTFKEFLGTFPQEHALHHAETYIDFYLTIKDIYIAGSQKLADCPEPLTVYKRLQLVRKKIDLDSFRTTLGLLEHYYLSGHPYPFICATPNPADPFPSLQKRPYLSN